MMLSFALPAVALLVSTVVRGQENCPGYRATNLQQSESGLTLDLELAGTPCNVFGTDLSELRLTVEYQTDTRLHVIIEDRNQTVYQVPEAVFTRPQVEGSGSASNSQLRFNYTEDPFSFSVARPDGEVLFNTADTPIVFESQYVYLRTSLPSHPNLYGLGEHTDPFRLNTTNYTRTLWTRDAYGTPPGTNLYGAHPIYLDHRGESGTHGVVLLNSNGMDIKINDTDGQYLEYNILGGVLDFYFVAGPSPVEASQQIAGVVGLPAMIPYAGLGFHQCRYGYRDVYQVAEVVYNYSVAEIPLETMWTDIDYMELRRVFSLDPERFPLEKVRELVDYLHAHQQQYTVMVDPAVAYVDYDAFNTGRDDGIFMKTANGSIYQGVVWPGVSAFPDWFNPNTQTYWDTQFNSFFNKDTGVDIDFLWIDMNEPANFCDYPCSDPAGFASESGNPPAPPPVRDGPAIELPGFPPDFQPSDAKVALRKRQTPAAGSKQGLPGRNLTDPMYMIQNAAGALSNKTANTDLVHYTGLVEYDTHNLYGTMMSNASRQAMLSRRPDDRPLIITRSTFLGAGAYVGHWLGDNLSDWPHYRFSIAQMMQFTTIFQIPMVGSDVCGFGGNTTETLCARWMMLGAFYPFYRNHNEITGIPQEAYRWESVAAAARYAIDIRYRLLDYFYTAFYLQTQTGQPALSPVFYNYPSDANTFGIEHQFFYGNAILVSPVTEENSTTVSIYFPDDIFYDWNAGFAPVQGNAESVDLEDIGYQTIPLHIRGGTILPLRARSANTTTQLRTQPFQILVAPGTDGTASGWLYLDQGSLLDQPGTTLINMTYQNGTFRMAGTYDYAAGVTIETISVLGQSAEPSSVTGAEGQRMDVRYNGTTKVLDITANLPLTAGTSVTVAASANAASATTMRARDHGRLAAMIVVMTSLILLM